MKYLGNNDDQVRLRRIRIELREVEEHLARHPQVAEAAVTIVGDELNDKRLIAYMTLRTTLGADAPPTARELRTHLKAALPDHTIPSAFVTLLSLPRLPNGELDGCALPTPDLNAHASRVYEAPQGETEATLANMWQEVLNVECVDRNDDFFSLGGNSLSAMRLIVRVADRFQKVMNLHIVFGASTLQQMARVIEGLPFRLASGDAGLEETPLVR